MTFIKPDRSNYQLTDKKFNFNAHTRFVVSFIDYNTCT